MPLIFTKGAFYEIYIKQQYFEILQIKIFNLII